MFSVNQLLALNQSTSVVHSLVDAFFEAKKVILKARLRDSMETVVEGVFGELEQQFQESLLKEEEQDDVVDGGDKAVVAVDGSAQNDQLVPYIPSAKTATVATAPAVYVESISNEAIPSSKNPDQQSSKEVIIPNTLVLAVKSKPGPSSAVQVKRPLKEKEGDEDDEDKEIPVSNASRKKIKQEVKDEEEDEEEDEKEVVDGESIATSVTTRSKKDSKQTKFSSSSSKKSYACTFLPDSCAYESPIKFSVVRHILNVHLKKSAAGIQENEDKDPSKYLAIKEA